MDELVQKYVGSIFRKISGLGSNANTIAFVTEVLGDEYERSFIQYELYSDSPLICYAGQKSTLPLESFDDRYRRIN